MLGLLLASGERKPAAHAASGVVKADNVAQPGMDIARADNRQELAGGVASGGGAIGPVPGNEGALLGGAGSLIGPIWGAIALVGMETALAGWTEHWQFWLGPILICIVLFARGGLYGFVASLLKRDGR